MLLTRRGTLFLYQGDELGMTNNPFRKISDFHDIQVKKAYQAGVPTGHARESDFLENNRRIGRTRSMPSYVNTRTNFGRLSTA